MNRRDFLRGAATASLIGISPKILWGADAPSPLFSASIRSMIFCVCLL